MTRLLIVLFVLFSIGCERSTCSEVAYSIGYPCPENLDQAIKVDTAFAPEQQEAIVEALAIWTEARPRVGWSAILDDVQGRERGSIDAVIPSDDGHELYGKTWQRNTHIQVNPELDYPRTLHTALHELGHLAGLDHGPSGTLMAPCWEGIAFDHIDEQTLRDFDALYEGVE